MDRRRFIGLMAPVCGVASIPSRVSGIGTGSLFTHHDLGRPLEATLELLVRDGSHVHSRPCFDRTGRHVLVMRAPAGEDPALTRQANSSPWSLWRVPINGGAPEIFFENPEIRATRPDTCWTTGKIAFSGIRGDGAELWTINEDGSGLTHIPVGDPPRDRLFYPSWYPDGDRIAVTDYRAHQVLTVSTSTGQVWPSSDPGEVWAGMPAVAQVPPNLDRIAFAGQGPGGTYNAGENSIWVVEADGAARPLDGKQGRTPAWSPAADRLAFSSTRRRPAPGNRMHPRSLPGRRSGIFIASAVASSRRLVQGVSPLDWTAVHPKLSPDGKTITFMAESLQGHGSGIAIINV